MVGKASAAFLGPQPTVNNFAAERGEQIRMAWAVHFSLSVSLGFPASAGQVC
jgi:hypothetical protein